MKSASILLLVLVLLAACAQATLPTSTPTPLPIPTDLPLPTVTPTATQVPLPAYMDEFIALGFDQQSLESDSLYAVYSRPDTTYAPDGGLRYQTARIFSWSTVYYIEDGELRSGSVINDYCVPTEHGSHYCYYNWGGTIRVPNGHDTVAWVRGITGQFAELYPGDYLLVRLELNWQLFKTHSIGLPDSFFEAIYPPFSGRLETFNIPGIGPVIPATDIILREWELPGNE